MLEDLKEQVCRANQELGRCGLVTLTFGNVSGIDRARGIVAIKPSGVGYAELRPQDMVLLDLDGKRASGPARKSAARPAGKPTTRAAGKLRPSTDAPTHLALYRAFREIGGITHTHSLCATMFAQAGRGIPCLGTTHADHFNGEVPVTRRLTRAEVEGRYEENTGLVIVERFKKLNPTEMAAVLVAHHGPFTWGKDAAESLRNSIALELIAQAALGTLHLNGSIGPIREFLLAKHFRRKHGPSAYYGQRE
jgi:L-ribulose-5-phosphate 4-epimerase